MATSKAKTTRAKVSLVNGYEVPPTGGDILHAPESPEFRSDVRAAAEKRELHVNGKPIPEEYAHLIAYELTDEGIAEKNAGRAEPSGVTVTRDAWHKELDRGASEDTAREVWQDENPLAAAVARATGGKQDGFAYKLLSDRVIGRKGMRHYEIATDAKTHQPVKVGNMLLGRMPGTMRDERNEKFQRDAKLQLDGVGQTYAADQDRSISSAGSEGVSVLRPGQELHDHRDPERVASIGVRVSRGQH